MSDDAKLLTEDEKRKARIEQLADKARLKANNEIRKARKLIANLNSDLSKHGDPELWKRYGDLILANSTNASREDDLILVTDYFDVDAPTIRIPGEARFSLNEIAEGYFRKYTKARNGVRMVGERLDAANAVIKAAAERLDRIQDAVDREDEEFLLMLTKPRQILPSSSKKKKKAERQFKGARRFVSSDGFEILVGKKASDNDFLTFRLAKSLDLWMHAADYPGSHVVIRSSGKKAVPDRTLVEAAQLAAFYSDAREQPKAAVRYTQKKFVNKPRKSPPGLVSLSSFKTLLVQPQVSVEMVREEQAKG